MTSYGELIEDAQLTVLNNTEPSLVGELAWRTTLLSHTFSDLVLDTTLNNGNSFFLSFQMTVRLNTSDFYLFGPAR